MIKLGSKRYNDSGTINNGATIDSVKTFGQSTPIITRSSKFPFIIAPGETIRDFVKRKLFKATREESWYLLKSTSNLNLTGKSSKASSIAGSKAPTSVKSHDSNKRDDLMNNANNNQSWKPSSDGQYYQHVEIETNEAQQVTSLVEGPAVINVDPCIEIVSEPVSALSSGRKLSLSLRLSKKKKKKTRFAEDLTQSYPAGPVVASTSTSTNDTGSSSKVVKWMRKMRKNKIKPYEVLRKPGDEKEKKLPVKWSKRIRKSAIRICRYLGYGAQMVSPLTPYSDIPMPVIYDDPYEPDYLPYYGSGWIPYRYSGTLTGYRMHHYGLSY